MAKDPDFWCATDDPGPDRHNTRWMEGISSSKLLSELSIPGTHDTMTYAYSGIGGLWVWCQSWTLPIQLNMGVRFLDFRCRAFNGGMPFHHGDWYLGLGLSSALTNIVEFLQTNPSECVIVRIKQEKSNLGGYDFRDALQPFLESVSPYILKKSSMPTLGEARGKIVILANYSLRPDDDMLMWTNMKIEDNYKPHSKAQKLADFTNNVNSASSATWERSEMYISFTSFIWAGDAARANARNMNPDVHSFVRSHSGCLGIVFMNYP